MSTIAIVMIVILLITVSILIITVLWMKKYKKDQQTKEIDYRGFFIMGISFLPMGIIFTAAINLAFEPVREFKFITIFYAKMAFHI